MRRREFIAVLGAAAAWPLAANGQPERMRRIGVLAPYAQNDPDAPARDAAFLQALQESGWIDGHNVRIDYRWGTGDADKNRSFRLVPLRRRYVQRCRALAVINTDHADVGAGLVGAAIGQR